LLLTSCGLFYAGEFKKKDKLAKPKPSHKGTVIYRLKPFKNQVSRLSMQPHQQSTPQAK
jgi:hypothetical protein